MTQLLELLQPAAARAAIAAHLAASHDAGGRSAANPAVLAGVAAGALAALSASGAAGLILRMPAESREAAAGHLAAYVTTCQEMGREKAELPLAWAACAHSEASVRQVAGSLTSCIVTSGLVSCRSSHYTINQSCQWDLGAKYLLLIKCSIGTCGQHRPMCVHPQLTKLLKARVRAGPAVPEARVQIGADEGQQAACAVDSSPAKQLDVKVGAGVDDRRSFAM